MEVVKVIGRAGKYTFLGTEMKVIAAAKKNFANLIRLSLARSKSVKEFPRWGHNQANLNRMQ